MRVSTVASKFFFWKFTRQLEINHVQTDTTMMTPYRWPRVHVGKHACFIKVNAEIGSSFVDNQHVVAIERDVAPQIFQCVG